MFASGNGQNWAELTPLLADWSGFMQTEELLLWTSWESESEYFYCPSTSLQGNLSYSA